MFVGSQKKESQITEKQKEYVVTLSFTEASTPKTVTIEVVAKSEADAINKAKVKLSLHDEGNNYQVIAGASAYLK